MDYPDQLTMIQALDSCLLFKCMNSMESWIDEKNQSPPQISIHQVQCFVHDFSPAVGVLY